MQQISRWIESRLRGSWKTTLLAFLAALSLALPDVQHLLDGDAETVASLERLGGLVLLALQGMFTRDRDKSSESEGVK